MQLFIDIDTLVVAPTPLQACRGDRFPIELRFQKNATAIELPARTVGRVVFKLAGDFSGDFVIRAPWRRFGRSAGAFYLFNINFDHPSLDDLFVTLGGEVATVDLVMEFEWERGGARQSSRIVPIKIFNDYSRRDPLPPVILLNGTTPVTVPLNGSFVDLGANVTDDSDGSRLIMGAGNVNVGKIGTYTLTYRAFDVSGNEAVPVVRVVNVVDVVIPVISLIGSNVINLVVGATFTDPGANVTDNLDAARVISGVGSVNTALPGTYTLTYSATDAAGNAATPVTRSVIVSDVVAPVIALVGSNPLIVPLNSVFVDPGANVTDDVSFVGVGHQVFGTGTVNTAILGAYTLTYSVTDAAGNVATPVTRSVIVSDVVAPVIALIGSNPVNLNAGDVFTDDGANVTDDVDAARVISGVGAVNTALPGTYTLTYSATDAAGNVAAPVTRSVIVSDVVAPVITLVGANPLIVPLNSVFVDPGANVTDDVDAARVIAGAGSVDTSVLGATYTLTYSATDAAGNTATPVTRSVIVSDLVAPVIALIGANPVNLNVGDIFADDGANVTDDVDAPSVISGVGSVNTALPGTYTLTYSATDAAGNAAAPVTRNVIVSDVVAPVITLIGADPVNLSVGNVFTDAGANVTDDVDAARVISGVGPVNAALPGTYTLTYSATDAAGNVATPVTRSVIVSDVVAPVITLIGADPVNLNVGDVFTDDGANVTDDVDAARVISGTVLSPTLIFKGSYDNGYAYAYNDAVLYFGKLYYRHSNPSNPGYPPDPSVTANASWTMVTDIVDTSVAGTYVLTYAATDAAGNAATPVTRSVIVT